MMRKKNSTKVRGYPCRRYRPCCIEYWHFGDSESFNVYGDGFVSERVVDALRSHYEHLGVLVGWWNHDTPRSGCCAHL